MPNSADVIRGELVLIGLPDTKCFTSWQDFLASLPGFLSVQLPISNATNVVVSNVEPSSSQTTSVWFRLNNAGGFIGIYVFSAGAWQQIYPVNVDTPVVTNQIFWFFGDATHPPPGWTATNVYTGLTPAVQTYLNTLWYTEGGIHDYYSAVFTGF